jgi:hypothetical protein
VSRQVWKSNAPPALPSTDPKTLSGRLGWRPYLARVLVRQTVVIAVTTRCNCAMSHTVTGLYTRIERPSDAVDFEAELVTRVERIGEMRHHFTSNSPRTATTNH